MGFGSAVFEEASVDIDNNASFGVCSTVEMKDRLLSGGLNGCYFT